MTGNTDKGIKTLLSACLQSYLDNGWICLTLLWQLSIFLTKHLGVSESVEID